MGSSSKLLFLGWSPVKANLLPHLHHGVPCVFGLLAMALCAKLVSDSKLDNEYLLQDGARQDLMRRNRQQEAKSK